ncbi:MAG: M28 family peptidase [Planctomycetes bacterium]|nr:M28 family peptidase [Planctomycetota bacterium]
MHLRTLTALTAFALTATITLAALPGADPTSARMIAALDTVKSDSLKADLYFIASDEMAGRDTPSEEQRIAARFIRARLERLNWSPGARDGFFHTYYLEQRKLDEAGCGIEFKASGGELKFAFGSDYFLPSTLDVHSSTTAGEVVFAGAGTKRDFDSKALQGKWALCFDSGEDVSDVSRYARRAKCLGLIMAPGPDYAGEAYPARFKSVLERQRRGGVNPPKKGATAAATEESDEKNERFATVMLTREALTRLLESAKQPAKPRIGASLGELKEMRKQAAPAAVENVCGLWPGSDPELGLETILISAHYDHIGVTRDGQINNGADDNGSGTCGLMAIAEALNVHGPLRRSVMLIWVSGEEKGLWGSQAWTDDPYLPGGRKAICNINIDMIGRNAPDKLLVTPTSARKKDYNGLVRLTESLSGSEGFPSLGSADKYYERSDQANFAKLGIPVMFLFSDVHEDYHRPSDTAEKIDYDKIRRVSRLVLRVLDGMQTDNLEIGAR